LTTSLFQALLILQLYGWWNSYAASSFCSRHSNRLKELLYLTYYHWYYQNIS